MWMSHLVMPASCLDFLLSLALLPLALRLLFSSSRVQPPREEYWLFQCTNYPARPWMSLWTTVGLWSTCLLCLLCFTIENKKRKTELREQEVLTPDLCLTSLNRPVCLSAVASWALILADRHQCVGVYVLHEGSIYICGHAYAVSMDECVCVCKWACKRVHVLVGRSTGRYILLCHHLCSGRHQATTCTHTLSIPTQVCLCLWLL